MNQIQTDNKTAGAGRFLLGNGCILLATIFWGVNVPAIKALLPGWMTTDGVVCVRLMGACILFWIVSAFIKCQRIDRADWLRVFIGGAVGLFAFIYLFTLSLRYGNPIDISIIMTFPPVFVIVIGVLFRHQRPSWIEYVGVAVSFAGAVIVILANKGGEHGSDQLLGDLLALASTLCYACYLVILERPSHKYTPVSLSRWVFLAASLPALLLLPHFDRQPIFSAHTAQPWILIAFVLLCASFAAYFLVTPAIKLIGAELTSLYQYTLPIFATIATVLMGLGHLHAIQVVAMVIIIAGMVCTNIGKKRRQSRLTAPSDARP